MATSGGAGGVAGDAVTKAHRLLYHSTLGLTVIKKKKKKKKNKDAVTAVAICRHTLACGNRLRALVVATGYEPFVASPSVCDDAWQAIFSFTE